MRTIDKYSIVFFKNSPENVKAHKEHPDWFPKVNTMGMCTGRKSQDIISVRWEGFQKDWLIEENRVSLKRKSSKAQNATEEMSLL